MDNFSFLEKNNKDLFNIISEAECLFRDEYFEQSMVQVRRFAENLCKDLLGEKALPDENFDSMISTIKDNSFRNLRMQELADDLYFIKKQGNKSAHSSSSSQNGKLALECLERAFEISVFYSNTKYGYSKKLDKAVFNEELLMTGVKTPQKDLKTKYADELKKARTETKKTASNVVKFKSKQKKKQPKHNKSVNNDKNTVYQAVIIVSAFLLLLLLMSFAKF